MSNHSSIQIDSFKICDLFTVTQQEARTGRVELESVQGTLKTYFNYYKDVFAVTFPKLTQAQRDALEAICSATNAGASHTIIYETASGFRYYDGVTVGPALSPSDVPRIRGKIYIQKAVFPHWDSQATVFSAALTCLER
jgi:hypothetical protein